MSPAADVDSKESQDRRRRIDQLKSAFESSSPSPSSTSKYGSDRPKPAPRKLSQSPFQSPPKQAAPRKELKLSSLKLQSSPSTLAPKVLPNLPPEPVSPAPSSAPSTSPKPPTVESIEPSTSSSSVSTITSAPIARRPASTISPTLAAFRRSSVLLSALDDFTLEEPPTATSDQFTPPPPSATSEDDRFSTIDVESFSDIQLKTPTTTAAPEEILVNPVNKRFSTLISFTLPENDDVEPTIPENDEQELDHPESDQEALRTPVPESNNGTWYTPSPRIPVSPISPISPASTNVDFILKRLDKDPSSRASVEGREKLKEDFQRLQHELAGGNRSLASDPIDAQGNGEQTDWDFWGDVIASYEVVARTEAEKLALAIQRGIPQALRGMVWQLMSASKDAELERTYSTLLKQESTHEKAITRDLGRTFPQHAFFMDGQGIGQENLFNVLKAYSLYDPEVGYCQGLAFIGAALLLNMPDEEAFCVLVRLMYSYGARDLYLPEMPGLQLRLFQFDRLVEEFLPVLHVHFLRQGIKSSMFCSQWFLTMFSYRFPLDLVFRIFDSVFGHGVEAIFGFSVILLIKNEERLLSLKFDQILEYMKGELFDVYKIEPTGQNGTSEEQPSYRANEFVQDAFSVKITPFQLDNYANEWQELKRVQNAHVFEVESLRTANRSLTGQVRELEDSLASLNEEHCGLVKQLVMAKIEREEIESELVRYKLMYAEVVHDREDALSSHRISMQAAASRNSAASSPRAPSTSSFSLSFGRG